MSKSLVTTAAALAIVSLGSLISDQSQAGSSYSGPPKFNNRLASEKERALQNQPRAQATKPQITSFSSSSTKSTPDGAKVKGTSR